MIAPLDVLRHFSANLDDALALLKRLVEMESGSSDKRGIDGLAEFLAREFVARGARAEVLLLTGSGNALKVVWRGTGSGQPVLFLGHLDTVWPPGTAAVRPFALKDGKAYGPGVLDMKSGILLCLLVCSALHEQHLRSNSDVLFFFTPDEETGSAGGLPLLTPIAKACRAVLCVEPPLPGGGAKTFRKGETGGGSDGSFTAALGIPTLDGLGVDGDGAHAVHEHILVSDLPRRAALLGLLAQELSQ